MQRRGRPAPQQVNLKMEHSQWDFTGLNLGVGSQCCPRSVSCLCFPPHAQGPSGSPPASSLSHQGHLSCMDLILRPLSPGPHPPRQEMSRRGVRAGIGILNCLQLPWAEPQVWRHRTIGAPQKSPAGAGLCPSQLTRQSHLPHAARAAMQRVCCPLCLRAGTSGKCQSWALRVQGTQTSSGSDLPLLYLASAGCMAGEGQPRLGHPAQCPVLLVPQVPVTSFMLMREAWHLHQRWENLGVLRGQGRGNTHAGRVPTGLQDPSSPCQPLPLILSPQPRAVTAALLPATLTSGPAHRPFSPGL